MHYQFFNGGDRQSSADFFVDDKNIVQVNNYNLNYTWHCGDGRGAYGITNKNSIGIEMCINSDGNFTQTEINTIQLVQYLMKQLNIPISRVVRHYDASRKNCPGKLNQGTWDEWYLFKTLARFTGSPDYWINNFKTQVDGGFMQSVIKNYVACFIVANSFDECLNYLLSKGIIGDTNYWKINAQPQKIVQGNYAKIVMVRMGKTI